MGGLISLFLFVSALAIGVYYVFRKLIFRKQIPSDVSSDDLIGGALNLGVLLVSLFLFVYLLRPIFLDGTWLPIKSIVLRRLLLLATSIGLSYVVMLGVHSVFTSAKKTESTGGPP